MSETNPPKDDTIGNDYSHGPNPNPGGDIDTSGSALPPYEGRTTGEEEHSREKGPEPHRHEDDGFEGDPEDLMPPKGVGESTSRRGEDIAEKDGKEAGRVDTGTSDDGSERPTGESTARDRTSVGPQEGNAEDR